MTRRTALGAAALPTANVAASAIAFLMAPYLTSRLGPTEFGLVTLYLSFTQLLGLLFTAGGAGMIPVEYVKESPSSARKLRWTNHRVATILAVGLLALSSTAALGLHSIPWGAAATLIVTLSYVQAINTVDMAYLRAAQSFGMATWGQYVVSLANVAATVAIFETLGPSADTRLAALIIATFLGQALYSFAYFRRYRDEGHPSTAEFKRDRRRLVRFGRSILPHHASHWVRSSIDRYVIAIALGAYATGIYGLTLTLSLAMALLFASVSQACQPFLYRMFAAQKHRSAVRLRMLFIAGVLSASVIFDLVVRGTFDTVFSPEYRESLSYLEVMLFAAAMQGVYLIYSHEPFYQHASRSISRVTMTSLLVHLIGLGCVALAGVTIMWVCVVYASSSAVAAFLMYRLARRIGSDQAPPSETGGPAPKYPLPEDDRAALEPGAGRGSGEVM